MCCVLSVLQKIQNKSYLLKPTSASCCSLVARTTVANVIRFCSAVYSETMFSSQCSGFLLLRTSLWDAGRKPLRRHPGDSDVDNKRSILQCVSGEPRALSRGGKAATLKYLNSSCFPAIERCGKVPRDKTDFKFVCSLRSLQAMQLWFTRNLNWCVISETFSRQLLLWMIESTYNHAVVSVGKPRSAEKQLPRLWNWK